VRYSRLVPSRNDLRPGDILLLQDTRGNSSIKHKGIRVGQGLTSVKFWRKNKGQSRYVHALLWICDGSSRMPDVAEASGAGAVVRTHFLQRGTYRVYHCTDPDLAEAAAGAATNWATHGMINYAKGKAVGSVARSDKMGAHGHQRAQAYGAQIASTTPAWGDDGAFCSEFVVACYQAAATHLGKGLNGDLLDCDAKHCSVRALHDRLFRDAQFSSLGDLDYEDKDVAQRLRTTG